MFRVQLPATKPAISTRGLLVPVWCIALALLRVGIDTENDALWTAREGLDLLAGGALVHPDLWSWAPVAHDFVPNSPAWQWLLGLAWAGGGRVGLIVVSFGSNLLSFLALAHIARRLGAGELSITFNLVWLAALDGAIFVNRSALPAFIWLLVGIDVLWRVGSTFRGSRRRHAVPMLGLGVALWVTVGLYLHNSWTFWAVVLVACVAVWAHFSNGRSTVTPHWLVLSAVVGAVLAVLSGPLGAHVISQTFRVVDQVAGANLEWVSPFERGLRWSLVCLAAIALGAILTQRVWSRNRSQPESEQFVLALGLLLGSIAGLFAIRFLFLSLLCGMPLLAAEATRWASARAPGALSKRLGERLTAAYWHPVMLAAGALVVSFAFINTASAAYPALEDSSIAAIPRDCLLFADDNASAVLLLRPDVQTWWDDRQDYWGRDRWNRALGYLAGAEADGVVPAGTSCVLLHKNLQAGSWPPLAGLLDRNSGWRSASSGGAWRIWVPSAHDQEDRVLAGTA